MVCAGHRSSAVVVLGTLEGQVLYPGDHCEFSWLGYAYGKARLAGNGHSLGKRRNAVRRCCQANPKGIPVGSRSCVAVLDNGGTITFTLRLAAETHRDAESVMITGVEHLSFRYPKHHCGG